MPVKNNVSPLCGGDPPSAFHQQLPGLQHMQNPQHIDFITVWNRPGFPYGAPEV